MIVGALGGRLDQTLGNLSLLTEPELADLDIRLDDGVEEALFTRSRCEVHGKPADIVSLLPWGGEVTGVSTEGLRWPLHERRSSRIGRAASAMRWSQKTAVISLSPACCWSSTAVKV